MDEVGTAKICAPSNSIILAGLRMKFHTKVPLYCDFMW